MLVFAGDASEGAFVVLSGVLEIVAYGGEQRQVISTVRRGETINETVLFGARKPSLTARATEDHEITAILSKAHRDRVKRLQSIDSPPYRVHEVMAKRLRSH